MDWTFNSCHGEQTSADLSRNSCKTGNGAGRTVGHAGRRAKAHMVPICFAYDGSVFYSAIDRKPKRVAPSRLARLKNIKETPQVALLVDQYDEDWTRLWYVLVRGAAQLVAASAEHNRAIQRLRAKYPQYDTDMLADDAPVLRITPMRITAWGQI
jgi:PPOX class probable F420-dependent enzyme